MYLGEDLTIIIGPARSGTTMLGNLISMDSRYAYIEEPNVVWKYSNCKYKTDMLPERLASTRICEHIRSEFSRRNVSNKPFVVEKTPANSLRLSFVYKVFPKAKYVILCRDGRDVILSAYNKWVSGVDKNKNKLPSEKVIFSDFRKQCSKLMDVSIVDVCYYIPLVFQEVMFSTFRRNRRIWGPQFPGIHSLAGLLDPIELCALQWKWSVQMIEAHVLLIPPSNRLYVKYEDLCAEPLKTLSDVFNFSSGSLPKNIDDIISLITPTSNKRDLDLLHKVDCLINRDLRSLGYL